MQYGVCTWTFGEFPLEETLDVVAELGFDGVELLGSREMIERGAAHIESALAVRNLQVFSLTPPDADIAHPDDDVRLRAVNLYSDLIDFAAALGKPLVSCHGLVGRIAPIASQADEDALLIDSVRLICARAAAVGVRVVYEVLNRYETHQIHDHRQAMALVEAVGADNLGVLLDAYHMNIEEADPAGALWATGDRLWLYHAADSNRRGVGHGHIDFVGQARALETIGYTGSVIFECTAGGANPFTPVKGAGWQEEHRVYLQDSLARFRAMTDKQTAE